MKQEINIQYIKESKRIIDSYNNYMNKVDSISLLLEQKKDTLVNIKKKIDSIYTSKDTELLKHQQLLEVINEYDKEVNDLQNRINPYLTKIEKLKDDSKNLYLLIKEKYPGYDDKELQIQIGKQLENLKGNI